MIRICRISSLALASCLLSLVPSISLPSAQAAASLHIDGISSAGQLKVSGTFSNGVITVERATTVGETWVPAMSAITSKGEGTLQIPLSGNSGLMRVKSVDLLESHAPWTLAFEELRNLPSMVSRLTLLADADTVSIYLAGLLSPQTVELLADYLGGADEILQEALVNDLNKVITGGPLYDIDVFSGASLSASTLALVASSPQGETLQKLNRFLLEDAYSGELSTKRSAGFTNFVHSFSSLSTIAGNGDIACISCNSWKPSAEGGLAVDAPLSSPHIAMADRAGNIYIADKRAHAIRKISPDGILTTVAGNGLAGLGDPSPALATSLPLNNPNGLWVREDGTFYILDRDNGLIRKVNKQGIMSVMVNNGQAINSGRGLWVSPDESLLYFCAGPVVKRWDTTNGLTVYASGFAELGNLALDPQGRVVVTDSGRSEVVRIETDGRQTVIAGASAGRGFVEEGRLASQTIFDQVRGIWYLPTGGYFLCTDIGSQVWFVDSDDRAHLLLDGDANGAHDGDGDWFYNNRSTHKVSHVRQITLDYEGNLLITESDYGYVRKIRFLPFP